MTRCKLTLAGGAIEAKVSFLARPCTHSLGQNETAMSGGFEGSRSAHRAEDRDGS